MHWIALCEIINYLSDASLALTYFGKNVNRTLRLYGVAPTTCLVLKMNCRSTCSLTLSDEAHIHWSDEECELDHDSFRDNSQQVSGIAASE